MVSSLVSFVHPHSKDIDVGHYGEMSYYWECGLAQWVYENWLGSFKGHILCEDVEVCVKFWRSRKKKAEKLKFMIPHASETGMKAFRPGILKTPVAIMNVEFYQNLNEISHVIARKTNP